MLRSISALNRIKIEARLFSVRPIVNQVKLAAVPFCNLCFRNTVVSAEPVHTGSLFRVRTGGQNGRKERETESPVSGNVQTITNISPTGKEKLPFPCGRAAVETSLLANLSPLKPKCRAR